MAYWLDPAELSSKILAVGGRDDETRTRNCESLLPLGLETGMLTTRTLAAYTTQHLPQFSRLHTVYPTGLDACLLLTFSISCCQTVHSKTHTHKQQSRNSFQECVATEIRTASLSRARQPCLTLHHISLHCTTDRGES